MADEKWTITKLDNTNWMTWKVQIRHMLLDKELWGIVEGTEKLKNDANAETKTIFKKRAQKALTAIVMAMSSPQIHIIQNCENPTDAWKRLREHYEKGTLMTKLHLRKTYFKMEMAESTSVEKHLRNMKDITDRLAAMGSPIAEQDQIMAVLGSLPARYGTLVTTLGAQVKDLSWSDVEHSLLDEEMRRQGRQQSSSTEGTSALMAGRQQKSFKSKKQPKCWGCGKIGHVKSECPKRRADSGATSHKAQMAGESNESREIAFCAPTGKDSSNRSNYWVIDSGASSHMTWDRSQLKDYKSLDKPEPIKLGDDHVLNAVGIGTVHLTLTLENGSTSKCTLQDVLYVPQLGSKLFSVRVVTAKMNTVSFSESSCWIHNNSGDLLAKGILYGKLYRLNCDCEASGSQYAALAGNTVTEADLWHQRLGHVSDQTLKVIVEKELLTGIKIPKSQTISFCEGCVVGKMAKKTHKAIGEIRTKRKLELVHSDVCGPITPGSLNGSKYFITFTDDFSRCTAVYFMKEKSEALDKFKEFEAMVVGESGLKIGSLRTDNGGEYFSEKFKAYLKSRQINHQTTVPYTPEQNGVAERVNRTLTEKARAMVAQAELPKSYWAEAVFTATFLKNRTPTRALSEGVTPYEKWYGRKPNARILKVFGCTAYAHIPEIQRRKMDDRAVKLRFVGYDLNSKGYRLLDEGTKHVYIRQDVLFNEQDFGHGMEAKSEGVTETVTLKEYHEEKQPEEPQPQRPDRRRGPPVRFGIDEYAETAAAVHYACTAYQEPMSMKEAMSSDQAKQWEEAADAEYKSLMENDTWELVKLPPGRKTVGCKWVFKVKQGPDGEVERFKSRLVAKGYSQRYGLDYDETFSPVVRFSSIRTLLAFAVQNGMFIHQMDVITAFLNGKLDEDIYMNQPEGYIIPGKENFVCYLKRSIYGLKQSPRCWNKELLDYLVELGFIQSVGDPCVFVCTVNDKLVIIAVYVDDLILATEDSTDMCDLKEALGNRFKMKDLGVLHYCLGIEITQDGECLRLNQKQYILRMLEKFGMLDAYSVTTPADGNVKLIKDDGVSAKVDKSLYQSLVGSLLYAAVATRPDIGQSVSAVSKYSSDPTMAHLTAAKRVLRYLKGTMDLGLTYKKSDGNVLKAYSDSDWAGDQDDRHSTSGYVSVLSGGAVNWLSKKQASVALSTAEAEYIALSAATQEVIWLRRLLEDFGVNMSLSTEVLEDNQGAIAISKNPVRHNRTKHIDIRYHFIREAVEDGTVRLTYCPTKDMVADILTKPLPKGQFQLLRAKLGLSLKVMG